MITPYFCEATHIRSDDGCYEEYGHVGQHRGWEATLDGFREFHWDSVPEPEPEPLTFAPEEIGILLVALQPVQQFFPDLKAKLEAAKEAAQ